MEKMSSAMVAHDIFAPLAEDITLNGIPYPQIAFIDLSIVNNESFDWLARILDLEMAKFAFYLALIANLSTTFGIERCGIKKNKRGLWRANHLDFLAIYD